MSLPLPNWNLHVQIHSCPRLQTVSVYCHCKNLTSEEATEQPTSVGLTILDPATCAQIDASWQSLTRMVCYQCVPAPVRLETTVGASTIAASWHHFVHVLNATSSSRKNMVNFLAVKQAQFPERKEGIRFAAACYKPNSSARDGRPRDHVSQC